MLCPLSGPHEPPTLEVSEHNVKSGREPKLVPPRGPAIASLTSSAQHLIRAEDRQGGKWASGRDALHLIRTGQERKVPRGKQPQIDPPPLKLQPGPPTFPKEPEHLRSPDEADVAHALARSFKKPRKARRGKAKDPPKGASRKKPSQKGQVKERPNQDSHEKPQKK